MKNVKISFIFIHKIIAPIFSITTTLTWDRWIINRDSPLKFFFLISRNLRVFNAILPITCIRLQNFQNPNVDKLEERYSLFQCPKKSDPKRSNQCLITLTQENILHHQISAFRFAAIIYLDNPNLPFWRAKYMHVSTLRKFLTAGIDKPQLKYVNFSSCGGSVRRDSPDEDCVSMAVDPVVQFYPVINWVPQTNSPCEKPQITPDTCQF